VEADLAIVAVLAYRAVAIWIPAPIGVVALGNLRRTMARWEREDRAEAPVAVEAPVARQPEIVPLPQPEIVPLPQPAWRLEAAAA